MAKKANTLESRASILGAYQEVFRSPLGRKVLLDLMKSNHCLDTVFDQNPHVMAFMEGQRSVILRIFATLKLDIKQFLLNVEEVNAPSEDGLW
jgi:hypothetical protein